MTDDEYYTHILGIQTEVIAEVKRKLSAKTCKTVDADYKEWIMRHRQKDGEGLSGMWGNKCHRRDCEGKLSEHIEYVHDTDEGNKASIITRKCDLCDAGTRIQDYAENFAGIISRTLSEYERAQFSMLYDKQSIKEAQNKIKTLRKQVKDKKKETKQLRKFGKELGIEERSWYYPIGEES